MFVFVLCSLGPLGDAVSGLKTTGKGNVPDLGSRKQSLDWDKAGRFLDESWNCGGQKLQAHLLQCELSPFDALENVLW